VSKTMSRVFPKLGAINTPNAVYIALTRCLIPGCPVDPAREAETFDDQPAPGFACGAGLPRTIADTHPTSKES